jgi:hypothetical protein
VSSGRHCTPAGGRPSCPRSVLLLRPPARTSTPHGQQLLRPLQIQANNTGRNKIRFGTIWNRRKGEGRGCCAHRRGGVRPAGCYGSTARSCGLRDKRTTRSWRRQGWRRGLRDCKLLVLHHRGPGTWTAEAARLTGKRGRGTWTAEAARLTGKRGRGTWTAEAARPTGKRSRPASQVLPFSDGKERMKAGFWCIDLCYRQNLMV